jgi:formylglycine-generating enzyme required for sulfatase activity
MNGEPKPAEGSNPATGAIARGGAIYLGNKAKCQINGGIIERNKTYASNSASTGSEGGAIFMNNLNDNFAVSLTINGGLINDNECGAKNTSANKHGFAIFYDSMKSTCTYNPSSITENNDVYDASNPSSTSSTKCIVTFDTTTNYPGNTTKISPQIVQYEGKATAPSLSDGNPAPAVTSPETKHGNFLGWYTNPKPALNTESAFNFSTTQITSNLTLYAVWDFVYVPGAVFEGKETLCNDDTTNTKKSQVFIQDRVLPIGNLWVCDHEVTQSEYETYCKYGGDKDPSYNSAVNGDGDNYPAYYVSWYDTLVYCNLRSIAEGLDPVYKIKNASGELTDNPANWDNVLSETISGSLKYCGPSVAKDDWNNVVCDWNANGYRLPTEAEWEYFARGGNGLSGTQYIYSGSDTIGDVAWYSGNATSTTHVVKRKPANSLGLYDLSGNVWELCWDWCTADVQALQAATGPYGIPSGEKRVKRGCSWNNNNPINLPINHRNANTINDRTSIDGFRVVRNAESLAPAAPAIHTVTFNTTTTWPGSPLSIAPVQVYDGKKLLSQQKHQPPTPFISGAGTQSLIRQLQIQHSILVQPQSTGT